MVIIEIENKISKETILLFDLDGTLIETNYANFLAYNKAIYEEIERNIIYNPNERFTREKLKIKFPSLTVEQVKNIIAKKELFFEEFLPKTKLNKFSFYFVEKYGNTNKNFLVTNSRKNRALSILRYYNLENKFEEIFFRQKNNSRRVNKFKNVISKLNIDPKMFLIFENEQAEILDAIDAGISQKNIIIIK